MEEYLGGAVGCVADGRTYCAFFCAGMQVKPSLFRISYICRYVRPYSEHEKLCAPPIVVDCETTTLDLHSGTVK
jgi:hypothetical protein